MKDKVINIEAAMKGNLIFSGPVNLQISGKFEGELETKGVLTIGEGAEVKAKTIKGEDIKILGKVKGDIISSKRIELSSPASVTGNIHAPVLVVNEGVKLRGRCYIPPEVKKTKSKKGSKKK
ncbi:MAG: polymer-forming cytoskeletal protein [Candidatus Omnitrophica bacterium]|nr:polymer-forming cytoskeletal protein [Candidatus Omnitrophota bacterium]